MTTKRGLTLDTLAESFFYQHAGYSYDPKTETKRQGRIRCAKDYARAEAYAKAAGWRVHWEDEQEPWDGDIPEPDYLFCGLLYNAEGDILASLGMIGVNDPNDPYLRVVAAELALEAIPDFSLVGSEGQA